MSRAIGPFLNRSTRAVWLVTTGLLIAAVILLLPAACGAQAQDWQTFKYPADGFSAEFPSEPQQESKQIDAASGTVELHSYLFDLDHVALYVGVCDYGSQASGTDVDEMLEGAKNGALENSKAQLTRQAKIFLGSYHGVEFESEGENTHYIARIYIVGSKMYQTLVVYPSSTPYADAAHFLNSFQLLAHEKN